MKTELLDVSSETTPREIFLDELKLHPLLEQVPSVPEAHLPDGTPLDVHLSPYVIVQKDGTILSGKERFLKCQELGETSILALEVDLTSSEQLELMLGCAMARQTFNRDQQILVAAHWLIEEVKKSCSRKASHAAQQRHQSRNANGVSLQPFDAGTRALDRCRDRFQLPVRLIKAARRLIEMVPERARDVLGGKLTLVEALKEIQARKPVSECRQADRSTSNSVPSETLEEIQPSTNEPDELESSPVSEGRSLRNPDDHPEPDEDESTSDWDEENFELENPHAGCLVLDIYLNSREIAKKLLEYFKLNRCRSISQDLQELIENA